MEMLNPDKEKKLDKQIVFWSIVGIGTLCFWAIVAVFVFVYMNRDALKSTFMPHPFIPPPEGVTVFEETFDTNDNNWGRLYGSSVHVQDGKLTLTAANEQVVGLARCFGCDYLGDSFYFQAELLPEESTGTEYGVAFCASGKDDEYYAILVDPVHQTYTLYKHDDEHWNPLIDAKPSTLIAAYPNPNTLGVKYDRGEMEFHINGSLESSFTDPHPYSCSWTGFIVNNGLVTLNVDNVFAYSLSDVHDP